MEVTDEEVWEAQEGLARRAGTLVEPAGAVALAGVISDAAAGHLTDSETVVVLGTGAGMKDTSALGRIGGTEPIHTVDIDQLRGVLG